MFFFFFHDWLKSRLSERGLTQEGLAEQIGVSKAAVSGWIKTGKISRANAIKMAQVLNVSTDEVFAALEGKGAVAEERAEYDPKVYVGRIRGARLSAGSGEQIFDFEEIDRSHSFRTDYMRSRNLRPERCKLYEVRGDSMSPTINDGDLVMINMADRDVASGRVYALVGEDGLRVKRLIRRADGVIEMRSDNPLQHIYPPEAILNDNVAVIGRVVWHAGEI
jgi:phage repressor protein C with HTH and peptisase S24 domain